MRRDDTQAAGVAVPDSARELTRREFVAAAGAGLFVFSPLEPAPAYQEPARLPSRQGYPADFNAYLRIGADRRVTCLVGKVELGQGAMTSLAQLLAEELDVAFESVDMVMGDTGVCPWDMGTFGSLSTRQFGPVLRGAGAEARAVLLELAAEKLGEPVERLFTRAGAVSCQAAPGKRVTYAELVGGKRIERHLEKVPVKPVEAYAVVGQSPRRKDALDKVTGKARFAGDIVLAGMLYARVLRPPAHGARLTGVDTSAAEKAGARVVRDGDLVAVLHERPDGAGEALRRIEARFERPRPTVDDAGIFDHLLQAAPPPQVVHEEGSLAEGEQIARIVVDETYLNSYVAHAPLETHSAVAAVEDGKVTVWASTQTPFPVQQQIAQALGIAPQNVRVIAPYVGGGFGGKSSSRQAVEAARLAKAAGKPVQVVWDRAEEFFYDTFRPAAVVKIRAGLSGAGKLAFWDYKVVCAGDREARQFYDIPHQRTVSAGGWAGPSPPGLHPFAIGPWRAPSVNTNTFARESHIDILARKTGADPLQFRLSHLSDQRMRRVLETAAKQFGWSYGRLAGGRGKGVACGIYSGTYVAAMAEVTVDRDTGRIQVRRVVCAQDQGLVVNPEGSRQQIEGSVTMGLGYALTEEVRFKDGEVLSRNFDSYEIPRFTWVPKIEAILIENQEMAASGCGEPPIITMGAVVANAVSDAAGVRMLQLPMTPERVKAAFQRG